MRTAKTAGKYKSRYSYGTKMAIDVNIDSILGYLCESGPRLCPQCPSQCAYGIRYLKEYRSRSKKEKDVCRKRKK